jgi:hypothetical protein
MTELTVDLLKALGPTFATLGSAIWIVYKYFEDRREARAQQLAQADRENTTRMFEARKPFNDRQLALYTEVSQVTGRIVTTTDFDSPEWNANILRFRQLFWTELSMVEDESVKTSMLLFDEQLKVVLKQTQIDAHPEEIEILQQSAYLLASSLRASIESSWHLNLGVSSYSNNADVAVDAREEMYPSSILDQVQGDAVLVNAPIRSPPSNSG